jgi:hypothetical protein
MTAPRSPARAALLLLAPVAAVALGCAIGPDEAPGCHTDADCDKGFTCRAGACFGATTPRSPPDAGGGGDAGDGGDAG